MVEKLEPEVSPAKVMLALAAQHLAPEGDGDFSSKLIPISSLSHEHLVKLSDTHKLLGIILEQLSLQSDSPHLKNPIDRAANFLSLTAESLRVYREFQNRNIATVLIKGTALAHQLYSKPHLRQFDDIDLLIRPEQFETASSTLAKLGYLPISRLSKRKLAHELKTQHAIAFRNQGSGIELDLHWSLVQSQFAIRFDMEKVLSNSRPIEIMSTTVNTLGQIDTLLFISAHSSKTYWQYVRDSFDFMLAQSKLDEYSALQLISTAKTLGQEIMLAVSIEVASSLFELEPHPILKDFSKTIDKAKSLATRLVTSIIANTGLSEIDQAKIDLQLRSGLNSKLSYIAGRVFIPHEQDWNAIIPDRLFILHYLRKPIKTLSNAVRSLFSR